MRALLGCVLIALAASGCTGKGRASGGASDRPDVPLLEGLGTHGRKVTTADAVAQRYFDQGLNLLYAFNHDEAIRSFQEAARLDPSCAMAWWGVAIANGPHINNPAVPPERARAAREALGRARDGEAAASETERALIAALASRHADPEPPDRKPLDAAYAAAMREVRRRFPGDADVGALYAEAMMDLRPWDLWTADGRPQQGTDEIVATLETVLAKSPRHPLALHLYVHALEASPRPEKADAAADRLRDLTPGLGHLVHMPSHLDVRRGRWQQAIVANEKAMQADRRYRSIRPKQGYYGVYMAHNHHMLGYAAMMAGQSEKAIRAMDAMIATMPPEWAKEFSAIADGFVAMPLEARMRFGRWDEILAAPEPAAHFPVARSLRHYARGVALAAQGRAAEARAEQRAFTLAKAKVPTDASFGNNSAAALLAVADHLLEGEILYREGKVKEALASLRRGVDLEDALRYNEPPDWIQPVRHALGAVLVRERQGVQAEQVFRADLEKLPGNGWSLLGLAQSLRLQGKAPEAARVEAQLASAWAGADVNPKSSCYCQIGG